MNCAFKKFFQRRQRCYKELADLLPQVVFQIDLKGKIVSVNKKGVEMSGYTEKELLNNFSALDLFAPQDRERMRKNIGLILRGKPSKGNEYTALKKDGTAFPVMVYSRPIFKLGLPVGLLGILVDATEQKKAEAAKTEFVSLASHQLRTPLTTIKWYTEMLIMGEVGKISKEQREFLDKIYESSHRLVRLVNALLNVSRIELGTFVIEPLPLNIQRLAESLLEELQPQIKAKKLKVKKDFSKSLGLVAFDKEISRIILLNLLSNAVKYSRAKGWVSLAIKKKGKELVIEVSDNGLGIPEDQQARIFDKLFRADNAKETDNEGTGLGLYILKAVVEQAGGKVGFKSVENKGSSFWVSFPKSGMLKKQGTKRIR